MQTMAADTFTRERALEREIRPTVESGLPGVEVLAVELLSPARFCVYVDHPEGVDHGLCARVTHLLDGYREKYTVDVSSPGPDRPVRRAEHFRQVVGSEVQLKTNAAFGGKTRFRGAVVAADDTGVTVRVGDGTLTIPYDEIVRGNLIDEGVGGA
jgi:ribosome maturation factor RimP